MNVLHFGYKNIKSDYKIHDVLQQKKDLGIFFPVNLKFDEHVDIIVKKANRQLGIIARIFKARNVETIVPLYKTFACPMLEYNSLIWSPYMRKHKHKIKRIEIKMYKLLHNMRSVL